MSQTIDLSRYDLRFSDEFNTLSLNDGVNGAAGTWSPDGYWGQRTLGGNGERQLYVDPAYKGLGLNPFSIQDGVLSIEAQPISAGLKPQLDNLDYTSGMITSEQSFSQQYGYFEMRAELPAGQGLWPAFWLLNQDGEWPPELDVVEVLGHDSTKLYTTVHTNQNGTHDKDAAGTTVADMSQGFHTYGVDWQADKITFYFDGEKVFDTPTPADMHQPMYMIANLAVGGYWPGNPDASTPFPAEMKIDYIRAYQAKSDEAAVGVPSDWAPIDMTKFSTLTGEGAAPIWDWKYAMAPGQTSVALQGDWARYVTGNDADNFIRGSDAPYNQIEGGRGDDVMEGRGGVNLFVIHKGDGHDTILDLSNANGHMDRIRLDGFHFDHFDDVRPWLQQQGQDVVLRLDQDQALRFKDVAIGEIAPEQFVFTNVSAPPAGVPAPVPTPTTILPPLPVEPAPVQPSPVQPSPAPRPEPVGTPIVVEPEPQPAPSAPEHPFDLNVFIRKLHHELQDSIAGIFQKVTDAVPAHGFSWKPAAATQQHDNLFGNAANTLWPQQAESASRAPGFIFEAAQAGDDFLNVVMGDQTHGCEPGAVN